MRPEALQHTLRSIAAHATIACAAMLALTDQAAGQSGWGQLAGRSQRLATTTEALPTLSHAYWKQSCDLNGDVITFTPQTCPVVASGRVFATGRVTPTGTSQSLARLFCFDLFTGEPVWSAGVSNPGATESFSTPCIDAANGTVIHGSGRNLVAYDLVTGLQRWSRQLSRLVVNASPTVTTDRPQRNRCFITDFDGTGNTGRLYCINVDPFNAAINPYLPGDIVWFAPIGGSSGNTPAYLPAASGGLGYVYVSSVGNYTDDIPGSIYAFSVDSVGVPSPVWSVQCPDIQGFFGGEVATTDELGHENGETVVLYAATYTFNGGIDASRLVKVNGETGALIWSTPCNRSSSIPVPLPDHRILLSTGIASFGSVRSLQLFEDHGCSASRIWDSALSTWSDTDEDGSMDEGEYVPLGGWSVQPIVSLAYQHPRVLCGLIPENNFTIEQSEQINVLDLGFEPDEPGFIAETAMGVGSSAALFRGLAFSLGKDGLIAYGLAPSVFDVDEDGSISIDDLYAWEQSRGRRDINEDGVANTSDRTLLVRFLRVSERGDLEATR